MKHDLTHYHPEHIKYVLDESVEEMFPLKLDFLSLDIDRRLKTKKDAMLLVTEKFSPTFPENELVVRELDNYEKQSIREEYCILQENEVPKRKEELEEALEKAKKMKKDAEDAYASVLMEVAKYAAEVKAGIKEIFLKSSDTFCIALAGYYLIYTWDKKENLFVLAKGYKIPDKSEIWANETKNREAMFELFGAEFPEVENENDYPFGNGI